MKPLLDRPLIAGRRYEILLAVLLAGLVIQSFGTVVVPNDVWHDVLTTIVAAATFAVVFDRGRGRRVAGALVVVFLATGWSRHLVAGHDAALAVVVYVCSAVFFWFATWTIVRSLFAAPVRGPENVLGAACGYLIAGTAWASLNGLAYLLAPHAFAVDPNVAPLLEQWSARNGVLGYYSYAQMLTIGYADVTPLRAPATTISLLSTLFGLFYTAVVVSQFVGLAAGAARDRRP